MNIHYDREPLAGIDAAINRFSGSEFESPFRSTVPLLSWLKHDQPIVRSLLNALEMPTDCNLHLEYTVKSPKGNGTPSHTDLMVLSGANSLAVEAKWTEPRYETVQDWMKKGSSESNRQDVLSGWLDLLQKHAKRTLELAAFSDAIYQMVHRAASACVAGNPKLAYLLFEPSPEASTASGQQIQTDLKHLRNLLGNPSSFPFYVFKLQLSQKAGFGALASLQKGNAATGKKVSSALLGNAPLFSFQNPAVVKL